MVARNDVIRNGQQEITCSKMVPEMTSFKMAEQTTTSANRGDIYIEWHHRNCSCLNKNDFLSMRWILVAILLFEKFIHLT